MVITALGTSSKGNCYLVTTDTGCLIVDPGIRYREILEGIDYDLERIEGVVVSHSHGDHDKASKDLEKVGCQVFRPWTIPHKYGMVGGWQVTAVPVVHDVETYAFFMTHPEGRVLYVTDTSEIPFRAKAEVLMIEANYCEEILADKVLAGKIEPFVRDRIRKSHLSIDACCDWLQKVDLSETKLILLIHLSDGNSNAREFQKRVERLTGIETHIATNGKSYRVGHPVE
jgi:phosphoribosyl 1,2-cyclic phosphodiesterase